MHVGDVFFMHAHDLFSFLGHKNTGMFSSQKFLPKIFEPPFGHMDGILNLVETKN